MNKKLLLLLLIILIEISHGQNQKHKNGQGMSKAIEYEHDDEFYDFDEELDEVENSDCYSISTTKKNDEKHKGKHHKHGHHHKICKGHGKRKVDKFSKTKTTFSNIIQIEMLFQAKVLHTKRRVLPEA